jgi:hypothetical protein
MTRCRRPAAAAEIVRSRQRVILRAGNSVRRTEKENHMKIKSKLRGGRLMIPSLPDDPDQPPPPRGCG